MSIGSRLRVMRVVELHPANHSRLTIDCREALLSLGNWIVDDRVYQSDVERFGGMEFLGGEEHLQRTAFSDEARKALSASPSGD